MLLKKDNIERVVGDENSIQKLKKQGYEEVNIKKSNKNKGKEGE